MGTHAEESFKHVLDELKEFGFLLESDTRLPNVCRLVTGQNMKGSWWSHPLSHTIFAVNELLADHVDVLMTKLISGKVTFVHRKMWPQVYAAGVSREEWQLKSLSAPARFLLKRLDKDGSLMTNALGPSHGAKPGDTARELENRLLVHAEQVHTTSGAHAKLLETWEAWAQRIRFRPRLLMPAVARHTIEKRLDKLNSQFEGRGRLPWPREL